MLIGKFGDHVITLGARRDMMKTRQLFVKFVRISRNI